jgi:hypothetical protein
MEKNIWSYTINDEQVDKTMDLQTSQSNFSSLLTRMTKEMTSRARHVADFGSSERELMKLFAKLWCRMEDNMEHMERACTAVD